MSIKPSVIMLFIVAVWSATFISAKVLSTEIPPLLSAFLRFLIAGVFLSFFVRSKIKKIPSKHFFRLLLMGGTGILLYNFLFFYGFQYISASRGTLIVSLNPTVIGLIAYFFLKEKVSPIQWLGMGLSVIGSCIIMINKDPNLLVTDENSWKGDLLLLGCVLSWATYSTISKPVVQEIGAIYTVFCAIVIGTILLGIGVIYAGYLTPFYIKNITLSGWLNLAFLGVVATALCYVLYYQVIHLIGSSKSATYIALLPVFGVLLAFLLLDEILSIPIIIGGALAITGVYLSNKPQQNRG